MSVDNDFVTQLAERVRRNDRKRIVFPEQHDPRVLEAAERLRSEELVEPVFPSPGGELWKLYFERRSHKGITSGAAQRIADQPLYSAALMVTAGQADGFVGGAANSTADTVRALLHCIGP